MLPSRVSIVPSTRNSVKISSAFCPSFPEPVFDRYNKASWSVSANRSSGGMSAAWFGVLFAIRFLITGVSSWGILMLGRERHRSIWAISGFAIAPTGKQYSHATFSRSDFDQPPLGVSMGSSSKVRFTSSASAG